MSLCMNFIPELYNVFFFLFNFLIVLLTSFFEVQGRSRSLVCLADNVDSLVDYVGLDDVPLDSESEL